jgi:DNA mismatch repair protein MSH6
MLEDRLAAEKKKGAVGKGQKCVNREVCNVVSRGTFKNKDDITNYEPKFVLAFKKHDNEIGVTFFDVTTLKIFVGQFKDDDTHSTFRTLVSQIRPVEVIIEREYSSSEIVKIVKNSPVSPVVTPMNPLKCYSYIKTTTLLDSYFNAHKNWPQALQTLAAKDKDLAFMSLGMSIAFLEDALIDQQTIVPGEYLVYEPESKQQTMDYMVLDAQALQHLEVVESHSGKVQGSLLHFVDHCQTMFGRR